MKKNSPVYKFCLENHYCVGCGDVAEGRPYGGWFTRCSSCRAKSKAAHERYQDKLNEGYFNCGMCGALLPPGTDICYKCEYDNTPEPVRKVTKLW